MTNSVEYIIKLVADDSELKRKLSAGELLSKSEMAKIKQLLTSAISSADREAKNLGKDLRAGLDVDATQLEKTLQFISGIFSELEKTQNPIKDWAKTGKGVYSAFEKMQTSVGALAQNVATLKTGLNTLTSSFNEFKTSYQSFNPAQFAGMTQEMGKAAQGAKETTSIVIGLDKAYDSMVHKAQQTKDQLKQIFKEIQGEELSFDYSGDLEQDFKDVLEDLAIAQKQIREYTEKLQKNPTDANIQKNLRDAKLGAAEYSLVLLEIDERMQSLGKKSLLGSATKSTAKTLQNDITSIFAELSKDESTVVDKFEKDLKRASGLVDKFQENLQKALDKASKIQIDLTLPEYSTFLPKINEFVAKLNAKSDSFAKVELKPILVGEVQTPTILSTSDEKKTTKKSKKANVTLTPVDNVKAKITEEIAKLEAARAAQQQAYDALEEQHQKNREENPRNTTAGRQMNKILPVIQQYEQAIEHYKKLQELMDDPESAQTIASEWNKNQVGLSTLGAKQDAILAKTEEWRLKMINALSLSAKDLDFDFKDAKPGEALYREIEQYFEDNPINVTVNARGLAEQIKTVLDTEGISIGSGGGVATIDPKTLGPMIGSIVNSVLTGAAMPSFGGDDSIEEVEEVPVAESTEEAVESTRKYVKTLDEIPAHVDELVQSVMNFAKLAKEQTKVNNDGTTTTKRVPKGVKNAAKWLEGKGIRVSEINDDTSAEQVKQMIQDALLTQAKDGYASGSYFADALKQVIEDPKSGIDISKKNGQAIERLRQDIKELLKMGGISQETWGQWEKRQMGIGVASDAIGDGRALLALNSVRGKKNSKNIPSIESIQRAIDTFAEQGLDTENLELLKIAREELGDSQDEQAIARFKQYYEEFREETRGILETLNLLFGDFKGRVKIKNRQYDIAELYDIKKLPKGDINDAEVYSYLESKAIDKSMVGSSARREKNWRKALREEQRMIMGQAYASERASYLSAMPDSFKSKKTSILDHEVTVSPFTPKSDILTPEVVVDLERSITSAQQKIEANQAALQENEARLQQLDAEIVKQKAVVEQAKQASASVSETRTSIDQTKLQQAFDQRAFLQTVVTRGEQGGLLNVVNEFLALKEKEKKIEAEISELRAKGKSKDTLAKKEKELAALQKQLSVADVGAAYPDIVAQGQKLNAIIQKREELQEKLRIIDGLTVQEAKKRLAAWKKDEETVQKYKENPDSLKSLTESEQARIRGLEETISRREPNKKLYLHYIKNPDLVKTTLSDEIASLAEKEANQKSAFVAWAKAEAAKLPEAAAEIAKAAKPVVAQFKEQMDNLYAEAMNTKDKLKNKNLSDDERSALVGHLQNTLVFLKEVEEEYNRIAKRIGGDEFLLGKVKRQNIERLTKTYVQKQPSVVDERRAALSRAESDLAWTEQARKKAEAERKRLEAEKESQKIFVERIAKQKELQTLEEQEKKLVAEVQALENDGASAQKIEKKQKALEGVRVSLSQIKAELDKFGGIITGKEAKQTPIDQIQTHAITKAKEYQQNIIDLTAQKYAADYKLKEIDERQADIKKYKLGAGEGKSALEKTKRNWTTEFMRSDYVVAAEQALREKAIAVLTEAELESRKIFDEKVVEAMKRQGLNHLDNEETKRFLKSKQGRQLSDNFASEVDTNAQNIFEQYEAHKKDLRDRLLKDFTDSFKLDSNGALSATFKTQSEDGKFVDDVRVENVLKDLLSKLEAEKKDIKSRYKVKEIDSKIQFAEVQKKAAMESVGLTDEQVLSSEVVKEQIEYQQRKFEAQERLKKQQEELRALEEGALKGDTKAINAAKKKVAQTNEEIARYDVLIANRDKLIALNAKEKEGVELSAEEKRIVATEKLTKLQDKLEKSKQRVKTLEQQYDEAKGTDKAAVALRNLNKEKEKQLNLEKAVKGVERSVGYWTKKTGKVAETEVAANSEGGSTPITGGVLGAITNVIKESLSGVASEVKIDTSHLATEETLMAILALLGGDGDWVPEEEMQDTGLGRNKKKKTDSTATTDDAEAKRKKKKKQETKPIESVADDMSKLLAQQKEVVAEYVKLNILSEAEGKEYLRLLPQAFNADENVHISKSDEKIWTELMAKISSFGKDKDAEHQEEIKDTTSRLTSNAGGGLIGIMRTHLAQESTLQKVLTTLGVIAKLSKNNMTVLDMTDVKDVNGLLEALTKTEHNFEALATTADKFGAKYVNKVFDELTPQGLVKMLGIKGVESKYTEAETRDSALKGVAAEDAKEAADMLQESTGRAIKKTVERVGVELQTMTEKTDTKGNKTWSAQLSNKYEKAMLATNQRIAEQGLGDVFGVGTEANKTLIEYTEKFAKLLSLVQQFKANPSEELQAQINALLPAFDKAEEKLISLIARKDKFLGDKEAIAVFGQGDVAKSGASLKALATSRYGSEVGLGGNVAFNGLSETQNGARLFVDVLKDGSIKQYALEVDRATGQVKEFMLAETALANAFQNVNKAMRQNEVVQANVAIGDNPTQQEAFMQNAKSPAWNEYKKALADMEKYVAKIWQRMANGGRGASQKELDYIMALSEHVLALGKNVQKTSIDFKNFWAQNPDDVTGFNIKLKKGKNAPSRDEQVRAAMEKYAQTNAGANNAQYSFASFDNDTLRYKLTDAEGNIRNVSLVWNELYQQVAMVSDKSVAALDPLVQKIEDYKQKIKEAKDSGYLSDDADDTFNKAIQKIEELEKQVKAGTASFKELEAAREEALRIGGGLDKVITSNRRQVGTNAVNSVNAQYDKIKGSRNPALGISDDITIVKQYNEERQKLLDKYNDYVKTNQLNNPKMQEDLRRQAAGVQKLGRELLKSTNEAEKLQQAVKDSGTYTTKQGDEKDIGATRAVSAEEAKNIGATLQAWAKDLYGVDLQNVKVNATTKMLTGTLRINNTTVKDVAIQYNKATEQAYAFEKAERESLSGFPAFMKGLKEKTKAIAQYLFSMTSIYRVIGEVRKGIQYIRDIDKALVELRKVTDETEETYDEFLNTAAKTADRLGSTISAVTEATATFAKLGYSMEMASEMAEAAIVYKNVGDNIASTEDAANSIISTLKGFGLEASESMRIVDRFNEVGNKFAITSQGLGEALRLSASALNEGGNTLDEAIGIITAANEVVNDPSSVGTALKTLTLRLRGSKTELEEMGEDVSDMATTTSQLQAKLLALTGGKVDIMLDENTFKSSTQILREMASAWEDMSDIQRASALELMGGKLLPRRIEICASERI